MQYKFLFHVYIVFFMYFEIVFCLIGFLFLNYSLYFIVLKVRTR